MANIWCCRATVDIKEPIKNVQGLCQYPVASKYPNSVSVTMDVKCRTESEREPSEDSIIKQAITMINACYDVVVLKVHSAHTNFLLWERI